MHLSGSLSSASSLLQASWAGLQLGIDGNSNGAEWKYPFESGKHRSIRLLTVRWANLRAIKGRSGNFLGHGLAGID